MERKVEFNAGAWGVVSYDYADRQWSMDGRTRGEMDPLLAILFVDLAKRAGLSVVETKGEP